MDYKLIVCEAKLEDAEAFLDLIKSLALESDFLLPTPSEASAMELTTQAVLLKNMQSGIMPQRVLLCWIGNELVGFLGFSWSKQSRTSHIVSRVAIGIRKLHHRKGIASNLLNYAEKLWISHGYFRVEFTVMTNNNNALLLYKKLGYEVEGIRKKSVKCSDGNFCDELYLAKFLE